MCWNLGKKLKQTSCVITCSSHTIPISLKLPCKTQINLTPTPIPYDNREKERERKNKERQDEETGETDRKKKSSFWCSIKTGRVKGCKEMKRLRRGWDLLIKWLKVRVCETQTVADVILDFLYTLIHQHLSIYHSSHSIFFSKFCWLIPLCIWFSSISLIYNTRVSI